MLQCVLLGEERLDLAQDGVVSDLAVGTLLDDAGQGLDLLAQPQYALEDTAARHAALQLLRLDAGARLVNVEEADHDQLRRRREVAQRRRNLEQVLAHHVDVVHGEGARVAFGPLQRRLVVQGAVVVLRTDVDAEREHFASDNGAVGGHAQRFEGGDDALLADVYVQSAGSGFVFMRCPRNYFIVSLLRITCPLITMRSQPSTMIQSWMASMVMYDGEIISNRESTVR